MQEKACNEVETVAKSHCLPSDVLFYVSKLWHNIYMKASTLNKYILHDNKKL